MTVEDKLRRLMEQGWNINIECKSCHREYAMTYEAKGKRIGNGQTFAYATGDTLSELVQNFENYIEKIDKLIEELQEKEDTNEND